MTFAADAFSGGFAEPVFAAQATFRRLMDAMARPGTVVRLEMAPPPPAGLSPAQAAIALALCDAGTPVFVDGALASPALEGWLAFHAGARLAPSSRAAFAFLGKGKVPPADLPLGSDDYPDRSATVAIEVASLDVGRRLRLCGPGILGESAVAIDGLFAGFADFAGENGARFPRGLDLLLTAGDRVMALPRTTRITAEEG